MRTIKILAMLAASGAMASAVFAYSGEDFVVCKLDPAGDNFLALRTCGSSKCRMIERLGPDTFLSSLEPSSEKGWRQVMIKYGLQDQSYRGAVGWVYDKYICRIEY